MNNSPLLAAPKIGRFLALALTLALGGLNAGGATAAGVEPGAWAQTSGETSIPWGWVDFCQRYKGECDTPVLKPADIELTPKAQKDLERVNRKVNAEIEAVSDMDHWGVVDRWDYPDDGKGDCEDFVLLKRRALVRMGYPVQALLITVVRDQKNEGHAILTVRTDRGDYVMDNLNDEMKPWRKTGYRFVKRQSQSDPNTWITILDPAGPVSGASVAATRSLPATPKTR